MNIFTCGLRKAACPFLVWVGLVHTVEVMNGTEGGPAFSKKEFCQ